jgi:hypothetical protein
MASSNSLTGNRTTIRIQGVKNIIWIDLNHRFTMAGADLKAFVPVRKALSAARELQAESRCIDAFVDDTTLIRDKRITRYATCSGCWNTFDSVKKDIQLHMP